jgi:septal ring factor EnvC (AmiA/AmiB activator)
MSLLKKNALFVLAIFVMSATIPAFATDVKSSEKDECLLASKGCKDQVDSIQQRIKKINAEIKKGKNAYSAEELKKLQQKLKEADDILKDLEKQHH